MLIVIPARYDSTRLPGKPLVPILGKPLIQWTWEAAKRVQGSEVVVATDDARIQEVCEAFGANVIRTSKGCCNGTERVAEAVSSMSWHLTTEVVVNWQGDALLVPPEMVESVYKAVRGPVAVATPVVPLVGASLSAGHVDVWMDDRMRALGFTREPVFGGPIWGHVGIYAYRTAALMAYARAPEGVVERRVGLEQLRWLQYGAVVQCVPFEGPVPREVNYPDDIAIIEEVLR